MDPFLGKVEIAVWRGMAEALLIGLLVGGQREGAHRDEADHSSRAGLRDFVLVALVGALCGLLQVPWLTVAAFLGMVAMWVAFKRHQPEGVGLTTDLAAIAVFLLCYITAIPSFQQGAPLAIALAIVLTAFLEAKRSLHKFFRETLTEIEFTDTLRFLALIFIIYPLLPLGSYGPYEFFNPRRIWFFVILVSSISYVGYFLEKLLGETTGLKLTGLLGGLASTTAATTAFAQETRRQPGRVQAYWQAATLANAMQFPRVLILLFIMSPPLAMVAMKPLLAMLVAGLTLTLLIPRGQVPQGEARQRMGLRNPFAFKPAFYFGVLFAGIVFCTKAAAALFGSSALTWTSALGGLLDVDSIAVTMAEIFRAGKAEVGVAAGAVLLALLSNALFKTGIALTEGNPPFALRVGFSFAVMLGAGAAVLILA